MKLLILSGDQATIETGNGKTILNVANCFPDAELFNFFLRGDARIDPYHYFGISDQDVLDILLRRKHKACPVDASIEKLGSRNAWKHLARYWIWKLAPWKKHGFNSWINTIGVDSILLYLSDNIYQTELAINLTRKKNINLFIFTGEDYPLKQYDYLERQTHLCFGFRLFRRKMRSRTRKALKLAKITFFNSPDLLEAYRQAFSMHSPHVLYPISSQTPKPYVKKPIRTVLYGGSFGMERWKGIKTIAEEIYAIDPSVRVLIYGRGGPQGTETLRRLPNIEIKGWVSNKDLETAIEGADLLFHTEGFDDYSRMDLRFAFSTKIVESIMSGKPFLLFSPKESAGFHYCSSLRGPLTACHIKGLREELRLLFSPEFNYDLDVKKAHQLHSIEANKNRLSKLLEDAE